MKVIAIGTIAKPITEEQRLTVMPREVPDTLRLYLDGILEQFWFIQNGPGVVFLMNVDSIEHAKAVTDALPLVVEGFAKYEFLPVAPLLPLRFLLPAE